MFQIHTVGIIGLGLIGGSFAKAFQEHTDAVVLGCDTNPAVTETALFEKVLDGELTEDKIPACDLLIPALYPDTVIAWMKQHAPEIRKGALVIDTGGLKRNICRACFPLAEKYGFTFIGGHPMAGKRYSGYHYSSASIFHDASMILVPSPKEEKNPEFLSEMKAIFLPCGFGRITVCTAERHDKIIAFTSELAHIVSSAYIKSPTAIEKKGFSAGSYKDMTRVAWLNEDMWTDIFLENRDNLVFELDSMIRNLTDYRDALQDNDSRKLHDLLREGKMRKKEVDGV